VSSRVQHIARFSIQDWRTSRVRNRSALTSDPLLRLVYLEILFALYEHDGLLPSEPKALSDVLMLPEDDIARCIPILEEIGKYSRGGVIISGDSLSNQRVTEDLLEEKRFRSEQAQRGAKGGRSGGRANAKRTLSKRKSMAEQPPSPPAPAPTPKESELRSAHSLSARTPLGEEYDPADTEVADAFDRIFEAHPRKDNPDEARHAFFAELRAGKIRQNGTEPNGVKGSLTISEVEAQHGRWLRSETWTERDGKFACALGKWFAGGSYRVPPPGKEAREIPSGSHADSLWDVAADRVWSARDAGRLSTARAAELFGQLQKAECAGDQGRVAEILAEVPA
jgi:hypothetical protein